MRFEMVLTSLLLLAAVRTDLKTEKISNRLIAFGLAAGIGLPLCDPHAGELKDCVLGMFVPAAACWILFRIHALGAGDIKLFSLIGCLNGIHVAVNSMLAAFLVAAIYALFRLRQTGQIVAAATDLMTYGSELQMKKKLLPYEAGVQPVRRMHFSPAILLGYLSAFAGVDVWTFIR